MPKLLHINDWYQKWRRSRTARPSAPHGVLLLSCGGLGDTILFSHVIERFAKLALEDEPVDILLRKDGASTAFLFPCTVTPRAIDFSRLRKDFAYRAHEMNTLYKTNYRLVICTDFLRHPDLDEALAFACSAPETIAMSPRPWQKYQPQLNQNEHRYSKVFDSGDIKRDKILRWADFANWLNHENLVPPVARLRINTLIKPAKTTAPLILVQPFSAVKAKQSPPALYEQLIDHLPPDVEVVITGTSADLVKNSEYLPLLDNPRVRFDDSRFKDIQGLIRAASLVISVDTAMMHLAIALGTQTLGLASAAYVGEIVPYAAETTPDNADFYYIPMDCAGCLGTCIHPLEGTMFPCVAQLSADTVIEKTLASLS